MLVGSVCIPLHSSAAVGDSRACSRCFLGDLLLTHAARGTVRGRFGAGLFFFRLRGSFFLRLRITHPVADMPDSCAVFEIEIQIRQRANLRIPSMLFTYGFPFGSEFLHWYGPLFPRSRDVRDPHCAGM